MGLGQFTGPRKTYEYVSDSGTSFFLSLDSTLGDLTEVDLTEATEETEAQNKPTRFEPRAVYWQGEIDGRIVRKRLVCGSDSALYASNKSEKLTIDDVEGKTTGRVGEKFSFPSFTGSSSGSGGGE